MELSQRTGVLPVTTWFFWKFYFSLRTSYKKLICCTNNPNAHICTFCKSWSFIWWCFFPVSIYNPSLFIWLFREGSIILIKYASKIFRLKVFLGAIDNTDHRKSWLKYSWGCLKHSEFLSIPLSCSFNLILTLRIVPLI